jgi:Na+/H+ antiporter NhaD/arsenite permease-like protein
MNIKPYGYFVAVLLGLFSPLCASSNEAGNLPPLDLTNTWVGYAAIAAFSLAYVMAILEESTMLRKSKPMVLAASLIWVFISIVYVQGGMGEKSAEAYRLSLEIYTELFLFIMVSMTYLNAMEQRGVFDSLRDWLLSRGYGYKKLFWITGVLSFFLSSVCNNLTTALLMGSVLLTMGKGNNRFITLACINVVVATNAGGSFSPFGDITTLLVWQREMVPFGHFFSLFLPAVMNFLVPAAIMSFWVPSAKPEKTEKTKPMMRGAFGIILLFLMTILTAAAFENFFKLPPAAGMLAGLSYLSFYFFYLYNTTKNNKSRLREIEESQPSSDDLMDIAGLSAGNQNYFNVFHNVSRLEWDTLLFFYGVMISVGGLSFIGYLTLLSNVLYTGLDPSIANIMVGIFSAFIDNGTIMYAVLTMHPDISEGQWLLVTLTAGVGGSLLAIGSAAGVGLLGQTKGIYSFMAHLKWMPVISLGYVASIYTHFLINADRF